MYTQSERIYSTQQANRKMKEVKMSVNEAMEYYQISQPTLSRWACSGLVTRYRKTRGCYFLKSELDHLIMTKGGVGNDDYDLTINARIITYNGKWCFKCPACESNESSTISPGHSESYQCTSCGKILRLKHPKVGRGRVWLLSEIEYLRRHYPFKLNRQICTSLNRPKTGLETKASELGLHKDISFFDFETGPYWKGREGVHCFESKEDGAISIRKYKEGISIQYIRVTSGVWEPLHHHDWKKANGSIPEGHVLSFKDGDPMNAELKNIELLSRTEFLKKNTFNRFPLELKQAILLTAKLERKIKSYAKK